MCTIGDKGKDKKGGAAKGAKGGKGKKYTY